MQDTIAYRPLEGLTMAELGSLQRIATRYSEIVREHAYLIGLMNLATRTGDTRLLAATKDKLAGVEMEFKECSAALQAVRWTEPAKVNDGDGRRTVTETFEYATA